MNANGHAVHLNDRVEGSPQSVLILGLGSDHADDQAGWIIVDRIRPYLPDTCSVHMVSNALEWLDRMALAKALVIVDASAPEGHPGTVRRIRWPSPELGTRGKSSTHTPALRETLELANAFGWLPDDVCIYTIEASNLTPGLDPCDAVLAAVEQVVQLVLNHVQTVIRVTSDA